MGSDDALYVGNNVEFTVDVISDVTIYFNQTGNDSDIVRYPDSSDTKKTATAKRISIRPNQTIQIVGMNNLTFKDPITVIINTEHKERFDNPILNSIVLRTSVTGTTIRLRWHGGY